MDLKKKFGTRLKLIRKRNLLTQEKLAELTGIDSKHLSHIETGQSFPSAKLIENLARVLEVNSEDFFINSESKNRDVLAQEIVSLLKQINDRDLKIIHNIILNMVNT